MFENDTDVVIAILTSIPPPRPYVFDLTSADSGLNESTPPVTFGGHRQNVASDVARGNMSTPHVLFCCLPRLAVELSRLELVVLADILGTISPPSDSCSAVDSAGVPDNFGGEKVAAGHTAFEVLVEAHGATIVLHEAVAFAEDPGPHSYVLNLGSACLHLDGEAKSDRQHPTPMLTVSSGDVCVHEILRSSGDSRSRLPHGTFAGPLLFHDGKDTSLRCPSMEDLPGLGFVSATGFVAPVV